MFEAEEVSRNPEIFVAQSDECTTHPEVYRIVTHRMYNKTRERSTRQDVCASLKEVT